MQDTRRELLDDFVSFVGDRDDDEARDLAEGCLDRALENIWQCREWSVFRSPVPFELTLTVGRSRYALPDYFGRIGPGRVRNATRGGKVSRLEKGKLEEYYPMSGTTFESTGIPQHYEIAGVVGAHTQPLVVGEELEALSSDGSDVDIKLSIAGDDVRGRWNRNEVILTGMAPVSLGVWSWVDEIGKSYQDGAVAATEHTTSRGLVTVRKVFDHVEVQRLFSQESAKQHKVFSVYPKPISPDVLFLPIIRKVKRVFHDSDSVPMHWGPAIFEEMLIEWQQQAGELNLVQSQNAPRPRLAALVALENQDEGTRHKRAFGMGR